MLSHQLEFSKAVEDLYKPIPSQASDPNSAIPEGNPQGIDAAEKYSAIVKDLQETLKPELELIETRIILPANQLLEIINSIRKLATKRSHKKLDYDRTEGTVKKYETKKEKTVKDEERMYKAQSDFEIAKQEYDYFNDMLKQDLPLLFQLQSEFIRPLFVSFYYMQLNVFYVLYGKTQDLKIPYFDLQSDLVEGFTYKSGDIADQADAIGITHFRVGHAKQKLELTKKKYSKDQEANSSTYGSVSSSSGTLPPYTPPASNGGPSYVPGGYGNEKATYGQPQPSSIQTQFTPQAQSQFGQAPSSAPPVYGQVGAYDQSIQQQQYTQQTTRPISYVQPHQQLLSPVSPTASGSYGAPPIAPKPGITPGAETCTALYDFVAQSTGDLTFRTGDLIEIVQRTPDANGWWTGKLNGVVGVFPGNYVRLNQ